MGIEVPETCWVYHKCNKAFSDIQLVLLLYAVWVTTLCRIYVLFGRFRRMCCLQPQGDWFTFRLDFKWLDRLNNNVSTFLHNRWLSTWTCFIRPEHGKIMSIRNAGKRLRCIINRKVKNWVTLATIAQSLLFSEASWDPPPLIFNGYVGDKAAGA